MSELEIAIGYMRNLRANFQTIKVAIARSNVVPTEEFGEWAAREELMGWLIDALERGDYVDDPA